METVWMRFHLKAAILGPNLQKMMHQMGKVLGTCQAQPGYGCGCIRNVEDVLVSIMRHPRRYEAV